MEEGLIHRYFEKATALVLASAGIDSVEKQALHLLASEAERYARALGANAGRLAEAARRSECSVADIEAAAVLLGGSELSEEMPSSLIISSDLKKKLRLSVELNPLVDGPVRAEVNLPQLSAGSIDNQLHAEEGLVSPSKSASRRAAAYPEWLQREIESKQVEIANARSSNTAVAQKGARSDNESNAFLASLVAAEEEAREILTKKLKVDPSSNNS